MIYSLYDIVYIHYTYLLYDSNKYLNQILNSCNKEGQSFVFAYAIILLVSPFKEFEVVPTIWGIIYVWRFFFEFFA